MTPRELILVDDRVEGWESLIAGTSPDIPVVMLPRTGDGLAALAAALSGYQQLQALHVVSHGRDGGLLLGDALIDAAALARGQAQLAAIASHLASGADVLLYGCKVAADETGRSFVTALADALHADVAASDDTTGAAALGGDWDLEFSVGAIDFSLPFAPAGLRAGRHLLSSTNYGLSYDTSAYLTASEILSDPDRELDNRLKNESPSILLIDGGGGDDTLSGFAGDMELGLSDDHAETLDGGDGNDSLDGRGGGDSLDGGAGSDTMVGGLGADEFAVDSESDLVVEDPGDLTSADVVRASLSYVLPANIERLYLSGEAANGTGNASDNLLVGNDIRNELTGGAGDDTLEGGAGDDTLDGGDGKDSLLGGDGSDTYVVEMGDSISETGTKQGDVDTVISLTTFTLASTVENLILAGAGALSGTGNARANMMAGNTAANTLIGSGGNDTLDGGEGADSLDGGAGNDTYVIDDKGDVIKTESSKTDVDLVQSSVTFTLPSNVENLTLTGMDAIDATGNAAANKLAGNYGANLLTGAGGNDTLDGGGATDGRDTLIGGDGNDEYWVSISHLEVVTETSKGGRDRLYLDTDGRADFVYTLPANVEDGQLVDRQHQSGSAGGTLRGNGLDNVLFASSMGEALDGSLGKDTLSYGLATKGVKVNLGLATAQDTGFGVDVLRNFENLTGSDFNDSLRGNGAANVITGGGGRDLLAGGGGNDVFAFNAVTDSGITSRSWDQILDFNTGDKLDLSAIDAKAGGADDKFTLLTAKASGAPAFTSAGAQLQFITSTGILYGNTDTDTAPEFAIALVGVTSLSSTALVL